MQWRRDQPRVECYGHNDGSKNNRVSKYFGRPERMASDCPPPLGISFQKLVSLADVGISDSTKSIHHSHLYHLNVAPLSLVPKQ